MSKAIPILNNPPSPAPAPDFEKMPADVRRVWQALAEVNDPEYPVSLVDMGLIYGVQKQGARVTVDLTLTAMGCPCMDMIFEDIRQRLLQEDDIEEVEINLVWDPPWTRDRLSEKAIEQFRKWGISV